MKRGGFLGHPVQIVYMYLQYTYISSRGIHFSPSDLEYLEFGIMI